MDMCRMGASFRGTFPFFTRGKNKALQWAFAITLISETRQRKSGKYGGSLIGRSCYANSPETRQ